VRRRCDEAAGERRQEENILDVGRESSETSIAGNAVSLTFLAAFSLPQAAN
jgi:hypothetical protein